jgi:hypothetical protein
MKAVYECSNIPMKDVVCLGLKCDDCFRKTKRRLNNKIKKLENNTKQ